MAKSGRKPADDRHEAFARAYVADPELNATRAYRSVYPDCKSDGAARANAARLLANANVQAKIARFAKRTTEKLELSAERVLQEAMRLAFVDIGQFFNAEGKLLAVADMPAEARAALASIEHGLLGTVKLKIFDKGAALERLMKHLGLFELDNKQKTDGLSELLAHISGQKGSRAVDLVKPAKRRG